LPSFKEISDPTPLGEIIKSAFDTSLPVSGGWGYTQEGATVLESNRQKIPLSQYEHRLISMRSYLEMNMTQEEHTRYGSINVTEISRETYQTDRMIYDKVIYEVRAMPEAMYASFVDEYKTHYGNESFDLDDHFKRRREATLLRNVTYWFEVSQLYA